MKTLFNLIILFGACIAFAISIPISILLMAFEFGRIGKERMFKNIAEGVESEQSATKPK